jgi:histidinol-phosphatase (PHP family)
MLPADNHVHTEWSWDAYAGSMEQSCARALELGLPSIAFTEHVDLTRWAVGPELASRTTRNPTDPVLERIAAHIGADGCFDPPPLDVEGYLASVERCRERFPDLRILSGVELGEPHWFADEVQALLARGRFERLLGSLHSLETDGVRREIGALNQEIGSAGLVRVYLAEVQRMVETSSVFQVLAHIDYPIRRWSAEAGAYDPAAFEEEYRSVLRALAASGRALEMNTRIPLHYQIVRWWYEVGGEAVSFGSDAHNPTLVAHGFAEATAMVEAQGFRAGRAPHDFWVRGYRL